MALHFSKRIEIIEEQNSGPEVGMIEEVTICKPWADIKTLKGRDVQVFGIEGNVHSTRFIFRYREGIKSHMKVKYRGKYYKIISHTNDNEENYTITLVCETVE